MKHQCYFCGKDVDIKTGDKIVSQEGQIAQTGEVATCDYNTRSSESSKNYYVVGTKIGVCICANCIREGKVPIPDTIKEEAET